MNKENHFAVKLARDSLTHFLHYQEYLSTPKEMPPLFYTKRGAFVSLKDEFENLRGCIGTLEATRENLAQEIIYNAVSAGLKDPRFPPVQLEELDDVLFSVDVISPLEKISSSEQLQPDKYGVVVEKGFRRGVLLPDLSGVDTAKKQLAIAAEKADLSPKEDGLTLYRFEVTRFYEIAI